MSLSIKIPLYLPYPTEDCDECFDGNEICDECLLIYACYYNNIDKQSYSEFLWKTILKRKKLFKLIQQVKINWILKVYDLKLKKKYPTQREFERIVQVVE